VEDVIPTLDYTTPEFSTLYGQVLNYIHYDIDASRLKSELVAYAKTLDKEDVAMSIPAARINIEGSIAYCLNRGARLKPESIDRVKNYLDTYIQHTVSNEIEWEYLPDTAQAKQIRAYVACYSSIDNAKTRVLRNKLDIRQLSTEVRKIINNFSGGKTSIVRQLSAHYRENLIEAKQDPLINNWVKPLSIISSTIDLLLNNKSSIKASAKNAKARLMSSTVETRDKKGERAASKMTYKDEDVDLGVVSIDPTNIVGAASVVIFNSKTRHCEVYHAKPDEKLSVIGAKITNFNETTSFAKILRNLENDLPLWARATTIRRLEVLAEGIKGKRWEVTGKLNKNSLIIKVI
jgi:hypothetical protein